MMLILRRILIIVISTRLNMAWLNRWRTGRIQLFINMLHEEFTPCTGQCLCPYLMLMGNGVNSCGAIRYAIAPYGLHLPSCRGAYRLRRLTSAEEKQQTSEGGNFLALPFDSAQPTELGLYS